MLSLSANLTILIKWNNWSLIKQNLRSFLTARRSLERTVWLLISLNLDRTILLMMPKWYSKRYHPGVLYSLSKLHKSGCPFRCIVSSINTYNYNHASYLVCWLKHVSTNQFTIKDSPSFAEWAMTYSHNNEFMCSFDVSSLFTNVPLDETIKIGRDKLYA